MLARVDLTNLRRTEKCQMNWNVQMIEGHAKKWIVCSNYLPNYSTGIYSGRTMPFCELCNYFSFIELVRRGCNSGNNWNNVC